MVRTVHACKPGHSKVSIGPITSSILFEPLRVSARLHAHNIRRAGIVGPFVVLIVTRLSNVSGVMSRGALAGISALAWQTLSHRFAKLHRLESMRDGWRIDVARWLPQTHAG